MEDPKDTDNPEDEYGLQHGLVATEAAVFVRELQDDLSIERQKRQDVNDVHEIFEEDQLLRGKDDTDDEL